MSDQERDKTEELSPCLQKKKKHFKVNIKGEKFEELSPGNEKTFQGENISLYPNIVL